MKKPIVKDSLGNEILNFTQWDNNRVIYVHGLGEFQKPPDFHFWDLNAHRAIVVPSEIDLERSSLRCKVPNILMQYNDDVIFSVYQVTEGNQGENLCLVHIPVLKAKMPQDYHYEDNIDYITFTKLVEEAEALLKQLNIAKDEIVNMSQEAAAAAEEARRLTELYADRLTGMYTVYKTETAPSDPVKVIDMSGGEKAPADKAVNSVHFLKGSAPGDLALRFGADAEYLFHSDVEIPDYYYGRFQFLESEKVAVWLNPIQKDNALKTLFTEITPTNALRTTATLKDNSKVITPDVPLPATVKVAEAIAEITSRETLQTYFYKLRKSPNRRYQFEISPGGVHGNILEALGGLPEGLSISRKYFIYIDIPYSEAGGFVIRATLVGRDTAAWYEQELFGTLDANWHYTGWHKAAHILTVVIAREGSQYKADHTASQIIDAARKGIVNAEYEDPESGELRIYPYAKQMPDGRAVFSKDGYIEDGVPKQSLIYVDYNGNVKVETRDSKVGGSDPKIYACEDEADVFDKTASLVIGTGIPQEGEACTVIFRKGNTAEAIYLTVGSVRYGIMDPSGKGFAGSLPANFYASLQFFPDTKLAYIMNAPAIGEPVFAVCYDAAAPEQLNGNTWYVPKSMPKPSGNVGMMASVLWKNGLSDGIGYNVSLVWGEPDGLDNVVIVDKVSVSDMISGDIGIPAEGTVCYQLAESSGYLKWQYVGGQLSQKQFSTATDASDPSKIVPGLSLEYLPGMEIYVRMDNGNTADIIELVPDEGPSLPVYGNGTGFSTGAIPAGYILHLKSTGDYWQIINSPGGGGSGPALTITDYVPTFPKYVYDEGKLYLKNDRIYYAAKIAGGMPVNAGKLETAVQSGASIATEGSRYVYIFGGMTGSGLDNLTDGIWKYDTQEKVTTKLAAVLPTPRCCMAAAALDGKIYLFGGSTGYDIDTGKVNLHTTPEILVFNTATEQISTFSKAFEFGISGGYAGAYNGKLYYMGGKGKSAEAVYEIDPAAGTMTAVLAGISTATAFGSYAMVGDTLYTFGGKPFNPYNQPAYETDPPTNLIYAFKLGELSYSTEAQYFPEGFMESAACAVGTDIYILGGVKKNPDGGWLNVYDGKLWKFDTLTGSLTEQEYVQDPALAGNMMAKDGNLKKVYIMGGYHNAVGGGMKDDVSVMSFEPTFEMKELATMGDVPNYGTWTGGDF